MSAEGGDRDAESAEIRRLRAEHDRLEAEIADLRGETDLPALRRRAARTAAIVVPACAVVGYLLYLAMHWRG